jgi:hypothetical protein
MDFSDLTNDKFPTKEENILEEKKTKKQLQEAKKAEQEHMKLLKRLEKEKTKHEKSLNEKENVGNNELFSESGTEIIGKDRRIVLQKLSQYKELFPKELKCFKIKKSASLDELKAYVEECESIVNTSNCDHFILDGILNSIKVIEGVSANTKNFNISGLSDVLKANVHFHSLAKQLFLKYGMFQSTPPEYQMLFLISTSVYIVRNKNMKKVEMMSYLNEPINISEQII